MCRVLLGLGGIRTKMASLQLGYGALWLCSCVPTRIAWSPRRWWSGSQVPVFYHSCNFTGPYTDEALKTVAKFPFVVST